MINWAEVTKNRNTHKRNILSQQNILDLLLRKNQQTEDEISTGLEVEDERAQGDSPYILPWPQPWTRESQTPDPKLAADSLYLRTRAILDTPEEEEEAEQAPRPWWATALKPVQVAANLPVIKQVLDTFEVLGGATALPFKVAFKGDLSLRDRMRAPLGTYFSLLTPGQGGDLGHIESEARKMMGLRPDEELTVGRAIEGFRTVQHEIPWYGQILSNAWVPLPIGPAVSVSKRLLKVASLSDPLGLAAKRAPLVKDAVQDLHKMAESVKYAQASRAESSLGGNFVDVIPDDRVAAAARTLDTLPNLRGASEAQLPEMASASRQIAQSRPDYTKMMRSRDRLAEFLPEGLRTKFLTSTGIARFISPNLKMSKRARATASDGVAVGSLTEFDATTLTTKISNAIKGAFGPAYDKGAVKGLIRPDITKVLTDATIEQQLRVVGEGPVLLNAMIGKIEGLTQYVKTANSVGIDEATLGGLVSKSNRYQIINDFVRSALTQEGKEIGSSLTDAEVVAHALKGLDNNNPVLRAFLEATPDSEQFLRNYHHARGARIGSLAAQFTRASVEDPWFRQVDQVLKQAEGYSESAESIVAWVQRSGKDFNGAAKRVMEVRKNSELPYLPPAAQDKLAEMLHHPDWFVYDNATHRGLVDDIRLLLDDNARVEQEWGVQIRLLENYGAPHAWKNLEQVVKDRPLSFTRSWAVRSPYTKHRIIPDNSTGIQLGLDPVWDVEELLYTRLMQGAGEKQRAAIVRLAQDLTPEERVPLELWFRDRLSQPDPAVGFGQRVASALREPIAAADLSFAIGIQGFAMFVRSPVLYARTLVSSVKALTTDQGFQAYLAQNVDTLAPFIRRRGQFHNVVEIKEGNVFVRERGLSDVEGVLNIIPGVKVGSAFNWLTTMQYERLALVTAHAFWKRDVELMQLAEKSGAWGTLVDEIKHFEFFSAIPDTVQAAFIKGRGSKEFRDLALKELTEAPDALEREAFAALSGPAREELITRQANEIWQENVEILAAHNNANISGGLNEGLIGRTPTQKALERSLLFAPDFLRSRLGLVGTAATRGDVQGMLARSYLFSAFAFSGAVAELMTWGRSGGKEHATLDLTNPDAFDIRLPDGGRINILGQYKSLAKVVMNPRNGKKYVQSKLSVPASKLLEALTNKDFLGHPIYTSREPLVQFAQAAQYFSGELLPIGVQQTLEAINTPGEATAAGITTTAATSLGGLNIVPGNPIRELVLDKLATLATEAGAPGDAVSELRQRRRNPLYAEVDGERAIGPVQRRQIMSRAAKELSMTDEQLRTYGVEQATSPEEKKREDTKFFDTLRGFGESRRAGVEVLDQQLKAGQISPKVYNDKLVQIRTNLRAQRSGLFTNAAFKDTITFLKENKQLTKEKQEEIDKAEFFQEVFAETQDPITFEPLWTKRKEALETAKTKWGTAKVEGWLKESEADKTPTEKERDKAMADLEPYWEAWKRLPSSLKRAYEKYVEFTQSPSGGTQDKVNRYLDSHVLAKQALKEVSEQRLRLRQTNRTIDRALVKWQGYKSARLLGL